MRRAVYHVLQGKHQRLLVPRAKIAQLGKRLPAAKVAVEENTVVTAIQLLHAWAVTLACTTLKQINPAAYRVFLESTKTKKGKPNASSAMVVSIVV
jgi:hypothetical protein